MAKKIYLDNAAATPLDPEVKLAMAKVEEMFYNPSSLYAEARAAKDLLNQSRHQVAKTLGAKPAEIIFTAGGTESINLAILGVAAKFPRGKIVSSAIEHDAVLETIESLSNPSQLVTVGSKGVLQVDDIAAAIDDNTVLVSIMAANNEIGTIQPINQIGHLIETVRQDRQARGEQLPIYLHTDAAQAAGYLDLHVSRLGVDLMSLNGSKIYGPKQTGCLYVRTGVLMEPLLHGGGQEKGLRSGTENLTGAVGFAAALEKAQRLRERESKRLTALRDNLIQALKDIPEVDINGDPNKRLAGNVNVRIAGINGEQAVYYFDEAGVQISTGSACAVGKGQSSHVLLAIGLSADEADSSLRFTLGRQTSQDDIEATKKMLPNVIARLRQLAKQALQS